MGELCDIESLALSTAVETNGSFSCSSDLLNAIQKMSGRTFRDNLIRVQSNEREIRIRSLLIFIP